MTLACPPVQRFLAVRLHVAGEIVENCLPTLALELRRVLGLRIEGLSHQSPLRLIDELGADLATVRHPVLDELLRLDARVDPLEIKSRAAVLRLHARHEG